MRNSSVVINPAKEFDLKDFNKCLLAIWSLAKQHRDQKLAYYMNNILQFLKYVAAEDYEKAKALKPTIINAFKDAQTHPGLSYECYKSLTFIIDDFEHDCDRLFQLLHPPIGKKYLNALKAKIAKSAPQELAPYNMQSGGSTAFMLELDAQIQVYLFLDIEKAKQLALMEQYENQGTPEAKAIFKSCLVNYIEILFKQILLLNDLNEDDARRCHLVSLHQNLWEMIDKLRIIDLTACDVYVKLASNCTQQLVRALSHLQPPDLVTIEQLLQKAITAMTNLREFDSYALEQLSLLKLKMAKLYTQKNEREKAKDLYHQIVSNLMQCIKLADSTPNVSSDIGLQEFIRARKLDLTHARLSLVKLTSNQDESKQASWGLITHICNFTNEYIKELYENWKNLTAMEDSCKDDSFEGKFAFQKVDIRDTLESILDLYIQMVDEMLNIYIPATINSVANINMHTHNSTVCVKEIEHLEHFMKDVYPKLASNSNDNNNNNTNTVSDELVKKFSALKLKFFEKRFEHVEALIAMQSSESMTIITNLGTASVLLSSLKDAELSTRADLKARKQHLQKRITEIKGEALKNLNTRTKPAVPPSLSFLNGFSSHLPGSSRPMASSNNNAARQSSFQKPEDKPQHQHQPHKQ